MQKKIIATQQPQFNFRFDVDGIINEYPFYELPFPKIDITDSFNN